MAMLKVQEFEIGLKSGKASSKYEYQHEMRNYTTKKRLISMKFFFVMFSHAILQVNETHWNFHFRVFSPFSFRSCVFVSRCRKYELMYLVPLYDLFDRFRYLLWKRKSKLWYAESKNRLW